MRYNEKEKTVFLSAEEFSAEIGICGDIDNRPGVAKPSYFRCRELTKEEEKHLPTTTFETGTNVPLTGDILYNGICFSFRTVLHRITYAETPTVDYVLPFRTGGKEPAPYFKILVLLQSLLYCRERSLPKIESRLILLSKSGNAEVKKLSLTAEELSEQLMRFFPFYFHRIALEEERVEKRLPDASRVKFPFPSFRPGQMELVQSVYRTIARGEKLFVSAPTGIGKTISVLFPAVRAVGKRKADRIFYFTSKSNIATEAFKASGLIFQKGGRLRTINFTAKGKLCFNQQAREDPFGITSHCNPDFCPYAKGHYDKAEAIVSELLEEYNGYPASLIVKKAEENGVCPYELQCRLAEFCDIIILDYNYLFEDSVFLYRLFDDDHKRNVLLFDEAHNLPDRIQNMYSDSLSSGELQTIAHALAMTDEIELTKTVSDLLTDLMGLKSGTENEVSYDEKGVAHSYCVSEEPCYAFMEKLPGVAQALRSYAYRNPSEMGKSVLPLAQKLMHLYRLYEGYDDWFRTLTEFHGTEGKLSVICLDAGPIIEEKTALAKASVFFSATLSPMDYFVRRLGGHGYEEQLELESPFPRENFAVFAVTAVATSLEKRAITKGEVSDYIAGAISGKKGNYFVFFPSYEYLNMVADDFCRKFPSVKVFRQKKEMSPKESSDFLNRFTPGEEWKLCFCVFGGAFSEGLDLPGDRLIGAVIVGTGMPGISSERNMLAEYYNRCFEDDERRYGLGREYAYTYPGIHRVLQSAGRVIRTETDKGIIVLIDNHYCDDRYLCLLPDNWRPLDEVMSPRELKSRVKLFWEKETQSH